MSIQIVSEKEEYELPESIFRIVANTVINTIITEKLPDDAQTLFYHNMEKHNLSNDNSIQSNMLHLEFQYGRKNRFTYGSLMGNSILQAYPDDINYRMLVIINYYLGIDDKSFLLKASESQSFIQFLLSFNDPDNHDQAIVSTLQKIHDLNIDIVIQTDEQELSVDNLIDVEDVFFNDELLEKFREKLKSTDYCLMWENLGEIAMELVSDKERFQEIKESALSMDDPFFDDFYFLHNHNIITVFDEIKEHIQQRNHS
jgi:hypothetical protein